MFQITNPILDPLRALRSRAAISFRRALGWITLARLTTVRVECDRCNCLGPPVEGSAVDAPDYESIVREAVKLARSVGWKIYSGTEESFCPQCLIQLGWKE